MKRHNFKRALCIALSVIMVAGSSMTTFAARGNYQANALKTAYTNVMTYADEIGVDLGISYSDFAKEYKGYKSVAEYEQVYYNLLKPMEQSTLVATYSARSSSSSSSSGSSGYYYNTGTKCPSEATYSKYSLLSKVKKGDIIYESKGGFGITGHVAIVEGIYTYNGKKYIRVIEAIDKGVVRSILDDTRIDERGGSVYRVSSATSTKINTAVSFCVGELGSSYNLDFAKDTSSSETNWYCSELVWAGYKKAGIDIEVGGLHGEPGVTPRDITTKSSKTTKISYK